MVLNLFAELPEEVVTLIVSTWLDNADLGYLDSACCSSVIRPTFLAAARFARFNFGIDDWPSIICFRWLVARGVKLSSLWLPKNLLALAELDEFVHFIESTCDNRTRELKLMGITEDHVSVLVAIAENCGGLETINLSECDDMGELEDILSSAQLTLHTLEICSEDGLSLELDGITFPYLRNLIMVGEFSGTCFANIFAACPALCVVELCVKEHILPFKAIQALSNTAEHLRRLQLSFCDFEPHQTFDTLAQQCSNLVRLELTGIAFTNTPTMLAPFGQHCKNLSAVMISSAYFDDDCLTLKALSYMPNLMHLKLKGFRTCRSEDWAALGSGIKGLRSLSFELFNFYHGARDYLPFLQEQRDLRHLHLCTAPAEGMEEVFPVLAQRCPLLELLVLEHQKGCSYEGLRQVVEGCPNLQQVELYAAGTAGKDELKQKVAALGNEPWTRKITLIVYFLHFPYWA